MAHEEIWIKGAGLAGGLALAAIRHKWPDVPVRIFEKSSGPSDRHTWCFHQSDVPVHSWSWLAPLVSRTWSSYRVRFPKYERQLKSTYCAIRGTEFNEKLVAQFGAHIRFGTGDEEWRRLSERAREEKSAHYVIDATGQPPIAARDRYGYQKFFGLDVELARPHGLNEVLLKDVKVEQTDGYRFIYVLPWDARSLLIEDTYYSTDPHLDLVSLETGLLRYAEARGWEIVRVARRESGSLPLSLYQESLPEGMVLGAASGLCHPVTGYTLPLTVGVLQSFLDGDDPSQAGYQRALAEYRARVSAQFRFFRLLNRMFFLAGRPERRYLVLERFYRLSPGLIHRFYASQLSKLDRVRLLLGKPPVPIREAIKVLADS